MHFTGLARSCAPHLQYRFCSFHTTFWSTPSILPCTGEKFRAWRKALKHHSVSSSVGRGGAPERPPPPPEIGKIVVEIWSYLEEVYTFGEESKIQEICGKKCGKKSIFHRDFDQKISKFSWNFSHFWSKRAKFCTQIT